MAQCPGELYGPYPKGTRIMKVQGDPLDAHPLGPWASCAAVSAIPTRRRLAT
jgi:hypothetical protein